MATVTHTLTNGVENFIFTVTEFDATLTTINCFGAEIEKETMSIPALRAQWAAAFKHGCKRGWTSPIRTQPSAFDDEEPLYCD